MKTKFYWVALLASAALIAQANTGGHHGGGGGGGGGFVSAPPAPARAGTVSSVHSMPMQNFGGNRMIYSGQRFPSVSLHSPSSAAFRPRYVNSNGGASISSRQFAPGNINRDNRITRSSNRGSRTITNPRREGNGAGQIRNGN